MNEVSKFRNHYFELLSKLIVFFFKFNKYCELKKYL